jgi:asparagine synthase (glutamine-hydrolysing)
MPWEIQDLLPHEMAKDGLAELASLNRLNETIEGLDTPRQKVTAMEIAWYMRHQLLRDSDWAGMAHSLEIRVPFVDTVLLARLAPLLASDAPPSKGDMADTCRTALPAEVRHRAKTGFVVPVREWVQGETAGDPAATARGFRGWARLVYAEQAKAA